MDRDVVKLASGRFLCGLVLLIGLALAFAGALSARAAGERGLSASPAGCGLAWRVVSSPSTDPSDNSLRAVAALSAQDIWAVGYTGPYGARSALTEHWDGAQWSVVSSPDTGAADSHLQAIAVLAADDIWAVGSAGTEALAEHWNGAQWSLVPGVNLSQTGNYFNAISAVSQDDVWVAGYYEGTDWYRTLTEHWDGQAWSVVPSVDVDQANSIFLGVAARASDDAWAVGNYAGGTVLQTLVEHWDGHAWSIVTSPSRAAWSTLIAVTALARDDVWAAGAYNDFSPMGTLIEHWDGAQWSIVDAPDLGPVGGLAAVSPADIWTVGEIERTNTTLVMHWDGSQWSYVPSPNPGSHSDYLYGVAAIGPTNVWAVGDFTREDNIGQTLTERYSDPCAGTPTVTPTPQPSATSTDTPTGLPTNTPTARPTETPTETSTVVPSVTPCALAFSDVQPADYFYEAVRFLYCEGVVSGYADGTFRPYANTTRGQMAKFIVGAEGWPIVTIGGPHFTDVPPDQPFYAYIMTAWHHGIVSGYADGTFRPGADVTRGQLVKMVVVAEGWQGSYPPTPTFSDVPEGSPFYEYVETAYAHGAISGYADGTFKPGNPSTRGQICKVVYNAVR